MRACFFAAVAILSATTTALAASEVAGSSQGEAQAYYDAHSTPEQRESDRLGGLWFDCMAQHVGGDLHRVIASRVVGAAERACRADKTAAIAYKVSNFGMSVEVADADTGYPLYRILQVK